MTDVQKMSVGRATWIGTAWVNLPVLGIIVGGYGLLAILLRHEPAQLGPLLASISRSFGRIGAVLVLAVCGLTPITSAWVWWSFNVPKWRLWAMERTDDWMSLEREAISVGLIWDEATVIGWLFSKTEIWSAKDRDRLAELKRSTQRSTLL